MNQYVCLICGYVHTGDQPPITCPVCDAPKENFEKLEKPKNPAEVSGSNQQDLGKLDNGVIDESVEHVLILGGGIAALSTAEAIREKSGKVKITLVTNEDRLPYYRLNLTKYLAGEVAEGDLCIHQQYWYDENRIAVFKNRIVIEIDKQNKKVLCNDGLELAYDKLVIALGSHPFIPPIQGVSRPGVVALRSLADAKELRSLVSKETRVLVVGGGVLGLETAGALRKITGNVTIAEGSKWLMPRQLTETGAKYIANDLQQQGIEVVYEFRTTSIDQTEDGFVINSKGGKTIAADLIIIATGVRPNTYLARKAELEVHNGIIVDNSLRTSDEHIYAVGDISEHYGIAYGLWTVAQYQGKIAAMNLLGITTSFGGVPRSNTLKVLGVDLFSVGIVKEEDASFECVERIEEDRYLMFMVKDGCIVGGIAIGYPSISYKIKKAVESQKHYGTDRLRTVESILEIIS